MTVGIAQARPPYVAFELRPQENRAESMAQGRLVYEDVPFAIITPAGSRDRIERKVTEWFLILEKEAGEGRFPTEWLQGFKANFKAWQEGQGEVLNGTSVKMWPAASPSEVKRMIDCNLRTIEDVAAANEEAISRLGMGGRLLVDKAKTWLASAANTGKASEEIVSLRAEVANLLAMNNSLRERAEKAEAALAAAQKAASKE